MTNFPLFYSALTTHTPLIKGVEAHPLNYKGELSKTPCFIVFLLSPTPLLEGVNFHPLNYGGMGCQGAFSEVISNDPKN